MYGATSAMGRDLESPIDGFHYLLRIQLVRSLISATYDSVVLSFPGGHVEVTHPAKGPVSLADANAFFGVVEQVMLRLQ